MPRTCKPYKDSSILALGNPRNIWAIPAIHGELDQLFHLHDAILERFMPGDRLVYLGNYTGYGAAAIPCIDEILTFRRLILSIPGVICSDLVYLRGRQEEMWNKLLQIQFAPDPTNVLLWMLGNGLAPTLESYNISPHDGIEACRHGIIGLTKWTRKIREAVRAHAGHEVFANHLVRAAYTDQGGDYPMLFVHAGLNIERSLEDQGDHFFWSSHQFDMIEAPYMPFQKVIRGYDPDHGGLNMNCVTATLDNDCGFGGSLVCAGFDAQGHTGILLES